MADTKRSSSKGVEGLLHKQTGTIIFQAAIFQTSPPSTDRLVDESTFAAAAEDFYR
jgi:hypothetical protein